MSSSLVYSTIFSLKSQDQKIHFSVFLAAFYM